VASRNNTIDIAKGLGIILVVIGHSQFLFRNPELFRIIFSFHMPLFFFLSGIFLRDSDGFGKFLGKKAVALLKPYFSFFSILGICLVALSYIPIEKYCLDIIYATGQSIEAMSASTRTPLWFLPHLTPFWFLPHLFVALIFSYLVLKAKSSITTLFFYSDSALSWHPLSWRGFH
jgi:polysaccharide biosynthesis protein PslL